ncbi:MAG: hypothetical protein CMF96_06305 [Candidatus Marinimicrobia bacterium]|nr:hypothetical protein [Candidatus Neomarinimicrobiota bacterium]
MYYKNIEYNKLIKIYFKLVENIYPNYVHEVNNKDVFNKLYSKRQYSYNACCNEHFNLKNTQIRMKKMMNKTDYEKKIYNKANLFFKDLTNRLINNILIDKLFIKLTNGDRDIFLKKIKLDINNWNNLNKNIIFNRHGKILKIILK